MRVWPNKKNKGFLKYNSSAKWFFREKSFVKDLLRFKISIMLNPSFLDSSSGLPSSRKMKSYWRESSGGLRGW